MHSAGPVTRTHMDVMRTKCALGKAERAADQAYLQCQSAFATLHLLEGSVRLPRDGFPEIAGGSHDYHLINVTDEEIQGRAKELVKRLHADKIRELDEQIASISWPYTFFPLADLLSLLAPSFLS